ncbi:tetratricopeptide repeat protein [Thiohalophilus sp.]|uniref:tetratricopeptide repeat protein n=1 Tax=Thiohalophilus sp. TaxID=3028392 RepID=UPI002ACDF7AD|nr:tetratricopeptide repeat protein [Thiohalophilus sp.]MDZ7805251.1 tetratricopeptide repeat protein [Thiohalophilus sp.]
MSETPDSPYILSADGENFAARVLENSHQGPVLVNFCSPGATVCTDLSPVLEKVVQQYEGRALLVTIDVDAEPALARRYGVISVPTLKLFRRGEVVVSRHGYQSEQAVRRLLDHYVARESDLALADAVDLYARGEQQAAYEMIAEAVAADHDNPRLPLTLCKLLKHEQRYAEALKVLDSLPDYHAEHPEIRRLHDQLTFFAERDPDQDRASLQAQLSEAPGALEIRRQLVAHHVVSEDYAPALQELGIIFEQSPDFEEGYAARAMRRIFNLLGEEHPLVREYRHYLR